MYNTETTKMTPLDFRLIATAVFRLFSVYCSLTKATVNNLLSWFSNNPLLNAQVLSHASFDVQTKTSIDTFGKNMAALKASSFIGQILLLMVQLSDTYSAVHTNAFQMSVPGSNQYQVVKNFYPRHDNASFSHVSHGLVKVDEKWSRR